LYVDNQLCEPIAKDIWVVAVNDQSTVKIIYSAGTVPALRVNNFLINLWLADAVTLPGSIEFCPGLNFSEKYNHKDKQGRLMSLTNASEQVLDRNVGRNHHESLVQELKQLIDEKRNIF
jgi:hypothetical protein